MDEYKDFKQKDEKEVQHMLDVSRQDFSYLHSEWFRKTSIILVSLFSAIPVLSGTFIGSYFLFSRKQYLLGIIIIAVIYTFIPITVKLSWNLSKRLYFRRKRKQQL